MWEKIKNFLKRVVNTEPVGDQLDLDVPLPEESLEELEEPGPHEHIQSSVTFMVTKTGGVDINISWNDPDEITSQNLATVLYMVSNGVFEENCANLLVQIGNDNPDHMSFVRDVIKEWNKKKKVDPMLKPSEVFQFGTIPQQGQ